MTERQKAKARELRAEGLTYREIGERVGVAMKAAWRACNSGREAAKNKERLAYKREWQRQNYRGTCASCGSLTFERGCDRCDSCYRADEAERLAERDGILERLWAEGRSLWEIADHMGWSHNHIRAQFFQARSRGANLPYRKRDSRAQFPDLEKAA